MSPWERPFPPRKKHKMNVFSVSVQLLRAVWALPMDMLYTWWKGVGACTGLNRTWPAIIGLGTSSEPLWSSPDVQAGRCSCAMAPRKAGAVLQSKRRRKRVMPTCGVQAGEVQWELFNLPDIICSQLFLLMQSASKWHSQDKIKPTQSVCVCITLLNEKAWELFYFWLCSG